jgi:hypothetical protein
MRHTFPRTLSCLLASVLAAACVSGPHGPDARELQLGGEATSIPFRLFPELGPIDTSDRWLGGAMRADPRAPACPSTAVPASWRRERVATRGRFVEALEVALPPALAGKGKTESDIPAHGDTAGGVLAASWVRAAEPLGDQGAPMWIALWVGPENGYPTFGADTASRQLYAHECRMSTTDGERFVVEYAVRGPDGTDRYLAAFWPVAPGRYLRMTIAGFDAGGVSDARAIVGSVRAIRRDR